MKRLFLMILALCLFLGACAPNPGKKPGAGSLPQGGVGSTLYQTLQSTTTQDGGAGILKLVREAYNARTHAVYQDTALVQKKATGEDPTGDRILALSSAENKATLLFRGNLVGLYDAVAVAADDSGYHALNLEKRDAWTALGGSGLHYAALQNGNELYLFCLAGEGDTLHTQVITLDLGTLKAAQKELSTVYLPMAAAEGTLYLITKEGALAQADPATQTLKVVYTPEKYPLTAMTASGTGLLLTDRYGQTLLYADGRITNLNEHHSPDRAFRAVTTTGRLVRLIHSDGTVTYYDNQTWETIKPPADVDSRFPLPGGSYTYDPNLPNYSLECEAQVTIGSKTYPLAYQTAPLELIANEQCGVFDQEGYVAVVAWETGKQQIYKNESLPS